MSNQEELPDIAAVITPMGEHVLVKRGESGYWPLSGMSAQEYNEANGIPSNVANAYLFGSMFGWNTPGADPDAEMNKRELSYSSPEP